MTIKENMKTVTPPEETNVLAAQKHGSSLPHTPRPPEYGGRKEGLEATRYGDWELNGKCVDF